MEFDQESRRLALTTPLGGGALLPVSLRGTEAASSLFSFELELAASLGTAVAFERILGRSVNVELRQAGGARSFDGIVTSFSACGRDLSFARYRATVSPKVWLLTRTKRCRVFQQMSTPDILRRVLDGFDVSWKLAATYAARKYCVQYQESDFDFASRLMEEDGIWYSFVHSADGHRMTLSDSEQPYARIDGGRGVTLGEAARATEDWQVSDWVRTQEVRAARCVLRDHSFQSPDDALEAAQGCLDEVKAGGLAHVLRAPGAEAMELYEYPGGYAKRHDEVAPGGGAGEVGRRALFADRDRQARLRIEAEECAAVRAEGRGNCGLFTAGAAFELRGAHDAAGAWLLTRVEHEARNGGFGAGETDVDFYENRFVCIPAGVRLRPARATPRPRIAGVQTAVVVGPAGEEMFCDRYGRVKVQFFWDREGKRDADSSCWLRVAQVWAGAGWGAFFWPRIGHEVVVAFEDGDPDCPMVVGSVYNAANMPPYAMPAGQQLGGVRSASVSGSARQNFNTIVFNDTKGGEHLAIHSERNLSLNSEYDKMINAGRHKGERVANSSIQSVGTLPGGGSGGGPDGGSSSGAQGGSGMTLGNSVAIPRPVNEAPGLNAIWVFGENMQAALGINHQLAIGTNQQICINPAGLAGGNSGSPVLTGLLGGGSGGNIQLTMGTSVAITCGQAFEINLGPEKISIDGGLLTHKSTSIACIVMEVLAGAYALGYGLLTQGENYNTCGTYTIIYQLAFDACLEVMMALEMVYEEQRKTAREAWKKAHAEPPAPAPPNTDPSDAADPHMIVGGYALALLGVVLTTLAEGLDQPRSSDEQADANKPIDAAP